MRTLILAFLLMAGCATIEPLKIQEGLVYTFCSESPDNLNERAKLAEESGLTPHGTVWFGPTTYEGVTYQVFCQKFLKLEEELK